MEELCYAYSLRLQFSKPAWNHQFFLRAFPQSDARQKLLEQQIAISPHSFLAESRDSFGNLCFYGVTEPHHDQFTVQVQGRAQVGLVAGVPEPAPERWRMMGYPSPLTRPGPCLRQLAGLRPPERGERSPLERSLQLMELVHGALSYQRWVTGIQTTAEEALKLGAGVCQDFAQILLALCRMEGITARYVVGMLQGEGESHAWVEVLSEGCWYGLDPTNLLMVEHCHIKISCGRDYGDCAMNRGVFLGGGLQSQQVQVSVLPA